MTIVYARIANRTVADEYHAVSAKVDALYADHRPRRHREAPAMRRLRTEHRRMLGNGWCTRPADLDCASRRSAKAAGSSRPPSSSAPTLQAQPDHAAAHDQPGRAELYNELLAAAGKAVS